MLYKSSRTPDPRVKVNHYIVLVLLLASLPYHVVEESVVEGRRDGAGLRCFFLGGGGFFFPLVICLGLMNSLVFPQLLEH